MRDGNLHSRTEPLRIAFYTFFPGGGIGRYTYELIRAVGLREDADAELICSPRFQWKFGPEFSTWTGLLDVWTPRAYQRRIRFLAGQVLNPRRGISHAREVGHDVLHLSNVNHLTYPFWRQALDDSGLVLGISVHDVRRGKAMINRSWEDRQLKAAYRRADALFVHSRFQATELVHFANVEPSRVHVVPHGSYPHGAPRAASAELRRRYGLPSDTQVALFFGQIRDEKNLTGFLEAVASTKDRPHVLIAGKPWPGHADAGHYENLIQRLGLADSVTFINTFIPESDVPDLFEASDWVALPYRASFTSQSGVLNVAAAYQRPVLVSNAPVLKETIEECDIGVTCQGDSPGDLEAGIRMMMARIRDRYQHDFAGYHQVFSWNENARRTVEIYKNLCSGIFLASETAIDEIMVAQEVDNGSGGRLPQ